MPRWGGPVVLVVVVVVFSLLLVLILFWLIRLFGGLVGGVVNVGLEADAHGNASVAALISSLVSTISVILLRLGGLNLGGGAELSSSVVSSSLEVRVRWESSSSMSIRLKPSRSAIGQPRLHLHRRGLHLVDVVIGGLQRVAHASPSQHHLIVGDHGRLAGVANGRCVLLSQNGGKVLVVLGRLGEELAVLRAQRRRHRTGHHCGGCGGGGIFIQSMARAPAEKVRFEGLWRGVVEEGVELELVGKLSGGELDDNGEDWEKKEDGGAAFRP